MYLYAVPEELRRADKSQTEDGVLHLDGLGPVASFRLSN